MFPGNTFELTKPTCIKPKVNSKFHVQTLHTDLGLVEIFTEKRAKEMTVCLRKEVRFPQQLILSSIE
jgi:hypothetical protein